MTRENWLVEVMGAYPRTAPDLVFGPEVIPMVVVTGFGQGGEMAHAFGGPKLSGAFEPALFLAAGGLRRA